MADQTTKYGKQLTKIAVDKEKASTSRETGDTINAANAETGKTAGPWVPNYPA